MSLKEKFTFKSLDICDTLEHHLMELSGSVSLLQQSTIGIHGTDRADKQNSLISKLAEFQEAYFALREAIEEQQNDQNKQNAAE